MEMSQMLVMCMVLVAGVSAGMMKGPIANPIDTCDTYKNNLGDGMDSKYLPCNAQDDNGKELCYLSTDDHVKCDSVLDCPNWTDEVGCKKDHTKYCETGFGGKGSEIVNCTAFIDPRFEAHDHICFLKSQKCDPLLKDETAEEKIFCPNGDDKGICN